MLSFKNMATVVICTAVLTACGLHDSEKNHGHGHGHEHEASKEVGHDHDHGHENVTFPITAYTGNMELFAESQPLIVGHDCELLCHITLLSTFKPIAEGVVTATLEVAGKKMEAKCDSPVRPGIFKLSLKPEIEGKAKLRVSVASKEGNAEFVVDSLMAFPNHEEAEEDAENRESHVPNAVSFTKEMSWGVDFSTEQVAKRQMGTVISTVAQIMPSQGDEMTVVAKSDGVVALAGSNLVEGKAISAGQQICTVDASATVNNNLSAQQTQAATELQRAKAEYDRLLALRNDKLVLESEVLAAKAAFEQAQNAYNALHKGGAGGKLSVVAPRGGYLKQLLVSNGQFVAAGSPIAVITQSRSLRLKANVQSRYFGNLKDVVGANIRKIDNGAPDAETWSLADLNGRMVSYGRQTETDGLLVPVFFEVNNVLDLLPGSFVEMFIQTRGKAEKLTVPSCAVLEDMGNFFVFVQVTPEQFEKRQITIGETDGVSTEVKSGLTTNERVVARGAVLVKMQQAAGAVDPHSGHTH